MGRAIFCGVRGERCRGQRPGGRGGREQPLGGPAALLAHQHAPHRAQRRARRGERPGRAGPALDLPVGPLPGVVGPEPAPVLLGEGHEGQRVLARRVEDPAGRRRDPADPGGGRLPHGPGDQRVALRRGGPDRGGHGPLASPGCARGPAGCAAGARRTSARRSRRRPPGPRAPGPRGRRKTAGRTPRRPRALSPDRKAAHDPWDPAPAGSQPRDPLRPSSASPTAVTSPAPAWRPSTRRFM